MAKHKKDPYLPLRLVEVFGERLAISWQQLDGVRAVYRKRDLLPEDVYITEWEVACALASYGAVGSIPSVESYRTLVTAITALASWRTCKQVYRFEPDMEGLLYSQAGDCRLPVGTIKNMPYSCFYVEAPNLGGSVHGFFVFLDVGKGQTSMSLKFLLVFEGEQKLRRYCVSLEEGATLWEGMKGQILSTGEEAFAGTGFDLEGYMRLLECALQLVLYICAQNADINPTKTVGHHSQAENRYRHKRLALSEVKDKFREVSGWEVGFRIMPKIKEARAKGCLATRAKGQRRVTPHVRKSHWHIFWVGKKDGSEERRRVLKWVSHTYVNTKDPADLRLTVNMAKEKVASPGMLFGH